MADDRCDREVTRAAASFDHARPTSPDRRLPRPDRQRESPAKVAVRPFDPRMWPFLATGFGLFLAFGILMTTIGFRLQDRFGLTAQQTGQTTGLVTVAGAGMMLLVQAAIVPASAGGRCA